MKKQVELNYYRVLDSDQGFYIVEWDWILNLFKCYNNALDYVKDKWYELIDHCN